MEAGRELDALIAEKVMGWEWQKHPDHDIRYFRPIDVFRYGAIAQGDLVEYTDQLPLYSTDIAAAWQVWRKVPTFTPFQQGMFFSALRAHVATRTDCNWGDRDAALRMEPVDICNSALETLGVVRTLPDWYYE